MCSKICTEGAHNIVAQTVDTCREDSLGRASRTQQELQMPSEQHPVYYYTTMAE
jgi:hypothetical protein